MSDTMTIQTKELQEYIDTVTRLRAELSRVSAEREELREVAEMRKSAYELSKEAYEQTRSALEVAVKALKSIEEAWDITDPSCVQPRLHKGELARNDSLAASSIQHCIWAFEKVDRLTGRGKSEP